MQWEEPTEEGLQRNNVTLFVFLNNGSGCCVGKWIVEGVHMEAIAVILARDGEKQTDLGNILAGLLME